MADKTARILIVEDDDTTTQLIKWNFDEWKILNEIVSVSSAEEALEHLKGNDLPDIMFVDLRLGENRLSGEELAKIIRAHEPYNPITIALMTAGSATEEDEKRLAGIVLETDAFFDKPIETSHLFDLVRRLKEYGILVVRRKEVA